MLAALYMDDGALESRFRFRGYVLSFDIKSDINQTEKGNWRIYIRGEINARKFELLLKEGQAGRYQSMNYKIDHIVIPGATSVSHGHLLMRSLGLSIKEPSIDTGVEGALEYNINAKQRLSGLETEVQKSPAQKLKYKNALKDLAKSEKVLSIMQDKVNRMGGQHRISDK
eukprot:gene13-23_t